MFVQAAYDPSGIKFATFPTLAFCFFWMDSWSMKCLNTTSHTRSSWILPWTLQGLHVSSSVSQFCWLNGTICIVEDIRPRTRSISRILPGWEEWTYSAYCIYSIYTTYLTYCAYYRYLKQCRVVFFYINGNGANGNPIMATGKNHSMIHTAGDVAQYGNAINRVVTPPRRPTSAGSKNKVYAWTRGPKHSWV